MEEEDTRRLAADAMPGVPLFEGITRDELMTVLGSSTVWAADPGEVLVAEGAESTRLVLILQGTCEVRKQGEGRDHVIVTLSEGDVFGEVGLIAPSALATASVVATMPVQAVSWDRDTFRERLEQRELAFQKVLANLAEILGERLRDMLERWRDLCDAFEAAAPEAARLAEYRDLRNKLDREWAF